MAIPRSEIPENKPSWLSNADWGNINQAYRKYGGVFPDREETKLGAIHEVLRFFKRSGSGRFKHLQRDKVAIGMYHRISNPVAVDQNDTWLCGPAAFIYHLVLKKPYHYAELVTELFEYGKSKIEKLRVEAGSGLRNHNPKGHIAEKGEADWIAIASLRDSTTHWWQTDYDHYDKALSAITTPGDMESWLKKLAYSEVISRANKLMKQNWHNAINASVSHRKGATVFLLINADLMDIAAKKKARRSVKGEEPSRQKKDHKKVLASLGSPNHWVYLTSPIGQYGGFENPAEVEFSVQNWGKIATLRTQKKTFLDNYWGYIAASM